MARLKPCPFDSRWALEMGGSVRLLLRFVALMRSLWGVSILRTHISEARRHPIEQRTLVGDPGCGAPVLFCCDQM